MTFDPTYLNLEYIFNKILEFFQAIVNFFSGRTPLGSLFFTILTILALFFIIMIAYCVVRMLEIRAKEREYLEHEIAEYKEHQAKASGSGGSYKVTNEQWENVLKYLASPNASDWKIAVIEADTMLEDLTKQLGFEGDNLGERLKLIGKDRFKNLDDAWEAHLIRNRIAHEGAKFNLSQREAQRVIALYQNVFQEFGHI